MNTENLESSEVVWAGNGPALSLYIYLSKFWVFLNTFVFTVQTCISQEDCVLCSILWSSPPVLLDQSHGKECVQAGLLS